MKLTNIYARNFGRTTTREQIRNLLNQKEKKMGYYSDFKLSVVLENGDRARDRNIGKAYVEHFVLTYESPLCTSGESQYPAKWYGHEDQLKDFSSKNPDILLLLEGVGEDYDYIWRKYFKGGKMQVCEAKISFDEFNENKLQ